MKNKGFVVGLAAIITLLCIYFISFTWVSRSIEEDATLRTTNPDGTINYDARQRIIDSLWNEPVYNIGIAQYTLKEVKDYELKLGLDLQGGMHVTLEVSPVDILRVMSNNSTDSSFTKAIAYANEAQKNSDKPYTELFYDGFKKENPNGKLSRIFSNTANKGRIDFNTTNEEVMKVLNAEVEGAIERSFNILRSRIDRFGVTQPNIQRLQGTGRIQIELPGVDNPERVRKLLSGIAKLEFWEVYDNQEMVPVLQAANDALYEAEEAARKLNPVASKADTAGTDPFDDNAAVAENDPFGTSTAPDTSAAPVAASSNDPFGTDTSATAKSDTSASDSLGSGKVSTLFSLLRSQNELIYEVKDTAAVGKALAHPALKGVVPANMKFLWAVKPFTGDDGRGEFLQLFAIRKTRDGKAPLGGDVINDARQDIDQNGRGYEISMQMNAAGAKRWKKMTGENMGKRIAIVLDNFVYSAPTVQGEIPNGNSSITGSFTLEEAKDLANILKAGKLPAPTRIVEEAIVGPSLGKEAIQQGLTSILFGLLIVLIFMLFYYNTSGGVANLVLLINVFFIMGILAQLNAALTLPGIAGIVLTIGMSVDANVLIFERVREELKLGKSMVEAIRLGYVKAYSSIVDSNVTTFLTGLILFVFGSGPVKGFATTLMVGIACSMFTAVFISRVIIEAIMKWKKDKPVSFDTPISRNLFTGANYDIIGNRKWAYLFSGAIIVVGFSLLIFQGGLNLGVDFKGGRSYVVRFDKTVIASDVRTAVADEFQNKGTETKTFGASNQVKVTTSYLIDDESNEADDKVKAALIKGLEPFKDSNPQILSSTKVGATIADDIKNTSRTAIFLSLIVIFLYILVRFRSWQFGLGALVALAHDVLVVLSFIAIARAIGVVYEIDQVFIAAMLTVIGYSINDTVVVFDRIRENFAEYSRHDTKWTLNTAINTTFSRTVITSLTTLLVVVVLFFFGGEVLGNFSFSLLIGILFGTYSSIFIASPVVYDTYLRLEKRKEKTPKK
jgi:SecD/SecF fusion protein